MVVPRDEQDSFEYDPEEEVNIEKEKDGDSDESDEDYVPEGGSGESDGEGGEIQKEGVGEIQKEGVGEIQEEGAGEIQKEGAGEIKKEGEGSGMGKGVRGKGKGKSGVGMGAVGMGCKRQPKEIEHRYRKCKNIVREHPATPSPLPKRHVQKDPCKNVVHRSPGVHIKKRCCSRTIIVQKEWQNVLTSGMQLALTLDIIINVRSVHLSLAQGLPA